MKAVEKGEGVLLPILPEGYSWVTDDGDYNICTEGHGMFKQKPLTAGLHCYVRDLSREGNIRIVVRSYLTDHDEEHFDNLQDAIDVMAAKFTLGLYFEDGT